MGRDIVRFRFGCFQMGDDPAIPDVNRSPAKGKVVRFGNFEADLETSELSKNGVKVKLYGQPFHVLAILLSRPGEVVSRQELQQSIWPSDSYVDFEHGLNAAVNKLREALGDNSENPRFIETVPRRGYRFVGQVADAVEKTMEDKRQEPQPIPKSSKSYVRSITVVTLAVLLVGAWFSLGSESRVPRVLGYRQLTRDGRMKGAPPCRLWSHLVTDGPRIFFSETSDSVVQVAATGGEVVKFPISHSCFAIWDIAPDRTELIGSSQSDSSVVDQPLWSLSLITGQAYRLGNLRGHAAAWSPDGRSFAYVTGNDPLLPTDIQIAPADGSTSRQIARLEKGLVVAIRWSPNGRRMRMIVTTKDGCSPWEMSSDGKDLHRLNLFPDQTFEVCAAYWTPDGKYAVAGVARPGSSGLDLWAIREPTLGWFGKSAKPVQLTSGALGFMSTALSLNGKEIYGIGGGTRGESVRYDVKSQKLEPFLSGIPAEHIDYSRDGKWVTYVTFANGTLWRSRVDGSDRIQLTTYPLFAALPQWSPDGRQIVFNGQLPNGHIQIYVVSAEGGKPEKVTDGEKDAVDPTWSPDGKRVTFNESQGSAQQISSVDLSTRQVTPIPDSKGLYSPRMSPDGRFIVAVNTPENRLLRLFDTQTQKWSTLFDSKTGGPGWPQWSADSRYVYGTFMLTPKLQHYGLVRIGVPDGKLEQVADFNVPEGTLGNWGPWVGVTPDNSPLALRDRSSQDIYAIDVDWP
ncbi:MAG TPA: winged helix-turn-helix domain-containing protein [Terriglobales bacterium]|jgi:Tol biopolymer transport system component/DNA-binding winged helix-turn-helix (wHTH) protein|nr:winged helix-turn-helix domain-containing protein [Terriglobales bacterium]